MKRSQLLCAQNKYVVNSHKDEYLGWTKEKTHFVSKLASLLYTNHWFSVSLYESMSSSRVSAGPQNELKDDPL